MVKLFKNLEEVLCVVVLSLIVIVTSLQVFTRYFLDSPLSWAEELARFLMIWLVFFGASAGIKRKAHIKVDFFLDRMPPSFKKIFSILGGVLVVGILLILIYQGTMLSIKMATVSAISLPITWGFVYSAVPIGCFFILLRLIQYRQY